MGMKRIFAITLFAAMDSGLRNTCLSVLISMPAKTTRVQATQCAWTCLGTTQRTSLMDLKIESVNARKDTSISKVLDARVSTHASGGLALRQAKNAEISPSPRTAQKAENASA